MDSTHHLCCLEMDSMQIFHNLWFAETKLKRMLTFQRKSILVLSSWSPLSACSKTLRQFGRQGTGRHLREERGEEVHYRVNCRAQKTLL